MTKAQTLAALVLLTGAAFENFDIDSVKADVLDAALAAAKAVEPADAEKAAADAQAVIDAAQAEPEAATSAQAAKSDTVLVYLKADSAAGRLSHKGAIYERGKANAAPMSAEDFAELAETYGLVEVE